MTDKDKKSYTLENAPEEIFQELMKALEDLVDLVAEILPEYYESTVVSNAVESLEKAKR